ncbi:protein NODULATION SIGNALING PATHWAY 2 [Prosopis cineraria]|uniref:protein NODULATION SIGNALING PATHWAY 2 n=1 Tax=Prosopis cineraria TaxID=364024 RepID=UPI002410950B|nr:protein NODULATION SIGNALING PATHWAY 2 [Prosopis cineraria]
MTSLHTSSSAIPIMHICPSMDSVFELEFSGDSTTTTTPTDHDDWNRWSPLVNWEAFTGGQDDFQDLLESMMDEAAGILGPQHGTEEAYNSANSSSTEVTVMGEEATDGVEDFKGLRLVHLLMAAAEALTGANKSHDLARVILIRLRELVSPTDGSNMERLAAYFTEALQGLLEGAGGAQNKSHHKHFIGSGPHREDHSPLDMLAAFQLLQDMSPYVKFGHFTANQAILEAVADERRVHIVDYDIMEGIQWASLIQALASKVDGPPGPHLRITALSRSGSGRRSIATVQETGRRLMAFAASVGQPFSFHQCRLDSDETFRPSGLKLVRGEAMVFNCMFHLPHLAHRAPESVASFLKGAKTLNPRLVTLVEEEGGPSGDGGLVSQFMDCLHHYSALYDSLEAGIPMQSGARTLVERVYLGPRIAGAVARIYRNGGDKERGSWGDCLGEMGYRGVAISFANHCQANLLLGLFNDGYKAEVLGCNRMVLSWRSRRLLFASLWTSSSPVAPSQSLF